MKNLFSKFAFIFVTVLFLFSSCGDTWHPDEGDSNGVPVNNEPEEIYFTVTFNGNNQTEGNAPPMRTVKSGDSIILPGDNGLKKTNYTFGGWNINSYGTGTGYVPGTSLTPIDDIDLYAKWDAIANPFIGTWINVDYKYQIEFFSDFTWIYHIKVPQGSSSVLASPLYDSGYDYRGSYALSENDATLTGVPGTYRGNDGELYTDVYSGKAEIWGDSLMLRWGSNSPWEYTKK